MDLINCKIVPGLDERRVKEVLEAYERVLASRTYHHLGYPYNLDFDYRALKGLVDYSINNLGDPFIASNYGVHSRPFEVAVLEWFARLWKLREDAFWGYITACGTEGNLHGVWLGRENMTGVGGVGEDDVVLVGSKACHYSVWKAGRMYRMDMVRVETQEGDEVDYEKLQEVLMELKGRGKRVVMVVNVGTTVRGAVDDVGRVSDCFMACGFVPQRDFFLHVDGALFGMMMPFLDGGKGVTFENAAVGSISVSGHKFIGSPVPCGVIMTRKECMERLAQHVAYINSRDATILGSRNGHAPLFLWYSIVKKGVEGFKADVEACMENARYMAKKLVALGVEGVLLNELSSTVVFRRPSDEEFILKWQLACEGDIAHVVVMPNVSREKIDEFVADLVLGDGGC